MGADALEQARRLDPLQVDLGADRSRSGPEGDQVGHGRVDGHEVLTPGVAVGLDVGPEVALRPLGTVDHDVGHVPELLGLRGGVLDEVADGEEDAVVALRLDDFDSRVGGSRVDQQTGDDALRDEGVDVDDAEVERGVVRVGHHVDEPTDVRAGDLELRDDATEVSSCLDQTRTPDTEVRLTRELDKPLDGHIAEHKLGHALGKRLCGGNGESQANLTRGRVVDSSHEEHLLERGLVLRIPIPVTRSYYILPLYARVTRRGFYLSILAASKYDHPWKTIVHHQKSCK